MFTYFARLHEKYQLPVYPVALFTYSEPSREEITKYQILFPEVEVLDFNFQAIQLNRLNARDFRGPTKPCGGGFNGKNELCPDRQSNS